MNTLKMLIAGLLATLLIACGDNNTSYDGEFANPLKTKGYLVASNVVIKNDKITISYGLNGEDVFNGSMNDIKVTKVKNGKDVSFVMKELNSDGDKSKNTVINFLNNDTIILKDSILLRKDANVEQYASKYLGEYKGKVRGIDATIAITENKLKFTFGVSEDERSYKYLIPVQDESNSYLLFVGNKGEKVNGKINFDDAGKVYFDGKLFIKS
jgi:hypothetical protein